MTNDEWKKIVEAKNLLGLPHSKHRLAKSPSLLRGWAVFPKLLLMAKQAL